MLPQAQRDAVFATVRHGTVCTEGALSPTTANLMILKIFTAAAKTWRKLKRGSCCRRWSPTSRSKMGPKSSASLQTVPP